MCYMTHLTNCNANNIHNCNQLLIITKLITITNIATKNTATGIGIGKYQNKC